MPKRKRLDSATSRLNKLEEFRGLMPVAECAARVGSNQGNWYKWERGAAFPSIVYLPRIENLISKVQKRPVGYREIWPNLLPDLTSLGVADLELSEFAK